MARTASAASSATSTTARPAIKPARKPAGFDAIKPLLTAQTANDLEPAP